MANPQLVSYVKEQLSHKMDINHIRTLLYQQGWSQADVEEAIQETYHVSRKDVHRDHHTNFVAIAIAGIVVVILAAALFLVVYRQPPVIPEAPLAPTPEPTIPPMRLTGWAVCANEADSVAKETCYYDINKNDEFFDCDVITDGIERGFCYRAKETVVLERYAAES